MVALNFNYRKHFVPKKTIFFCTVRQYYNFDFLQISSSAAMATAHAASMYATVMTTVVMAATNGIATTDNVLGLVLFFAESLVITFHVLCHFLAFSVCFSAMN